jgi:hypothetical protein
LLDTKLKILGLGGFTLISSTLNLLALKIEEANKVHTVPSNRLTRYTLYPKIG